MHIQTSEYKNETKIYVHIYNFDSEVFTAYIGWRVLDDFVVSY
jgi:hypothetical protein